MPTPIKEFFNGGIVTARHPSLLNPGELQRADNCIYRENDPAIHRAPGRVKYSASGRSNVRGVTQMTFDGNVTDQLLILADTSNDTSTPTVSTFATFFTSPFTRIDGDASVVFNEVSTGGSVVGSFLGSPWTTFTATSGYPFTSDILGARVSGVDSGGVVLTNYVVTSLGADAADSVGHYKSVILSAAPAGHTSTVLMFEYGIVNTNISSSTAQLDGLNVGSAYYLWDGVNPAQVVAQRERTLTNSSPLPIFTSRPLGLKPVDTAPTIYVNTAQLTGWSPLLQGDLATGFYWFLLTEIYAPGGDVIAAEKDPKRAPYVIESAYTARDPYASDPNTAKGRALTTITGFNNTTAPSGFPIPTSVTPTGLLLSAINTMNITIAFPPVTNNGTDGRRATNWGVYMAGPTNTASSPPGLATFRRVATPSITSTVTFGATTFSGVTLTEDRTIQSIKYANLYVDTAGDGVTWQLTGNVLGAPNGLYGYNWSGTGLYAYGGSIHTSSNNNVRGSARFNYIFEDHTAALYTGKKVVGVEVQVKVATPSNCGIKIILENSSTGKKSVSDLITLYGETYSYIWTHGGPSNTLNETWTPADFSKASEVSGSTGFCVTIMKTPTNSLQTLAVDSIGVKVYYTGYTLNYDGPAYRVVTYSSQIGISVSDPANLPPPTCSTGDIFQGSLVLNDVNDRALLRYSLANYPEAFPAPYQLKPNSKRRDIITFIRTLGQVLLVGFRDSIKRINYLPRETDTDFQNGIAHDDVTTDHGIAGTQSAAKFDMPGGGVFIFYASSAGVFVTDAITTRQVNLDLDWSTTVKLTALNSSIVKVYPVEKLIVFYYCPYGATHDKNTAALYFSYAADKLKSGSFPAVGPVTVSARAATEANLSGTPLLITVNEEDNYVYIEDQGEIVPTTYQVSGLTGTIAHQGGAPLIRTRRMFVGGESRLAREQKVLILYTKSGTILTTTNIPVTRGSTDIDAVSGSKFTGVLKGMRVIGMSIKPGTIVVKDPTDSGYSVNKIAVSQAAIDTIAADTLTFDTGTFSVNVRGSNINEDVSSLSTSYKSTVVGDLTSTQPDNAKQGIEFQIEKVVLPDGTIVDLDTSMRLHNLTVMVDDLGQEQTRSTT